MEEKAKTHDYFESIPPRAFLEPLMYMDPYNRFNSKSQPFRYQPMA